MQEHKTATYNGIPIYIKSVSITGGIETGDDNYYKNAEVKRINTDDKIPYKPKTFQEDLKEKQQKAEEKEEDARGVARRDTLQILSKPTPKEDVAPATITAQRRREVVVSCFVITRESSSAKNNLLKSFTSGEIGKLQVVGIKDVVDVRPKTWKMNESDSALGITSFEIAFIEDTEIKQEITFAGSVREDFNNALSAIGRALIGEKAQTVKDYLIDKITWLSRTSLLGLSIDVLSDIYLSSYNTVASIPTLFRVLQDLGLNRTYKPFLHFLGVLFSLEKMLRENDVEDKKQIEAIVLKDLDKAVSFVDASSLISSMQTVKASYLVEASKLPEAQYKTKNIKRSTPWLTVCKSIYGNINNEKQLQQINKKNINPLFFKGNILYNAVAN